MTEGPVRICLIKKLLQRQPYKNSAIFLLRVRWKLKISQDVVVVIIIMIVHIIFCSRFTSCSTGHTITITKYVSKRKKLFELLHYYEIRILVFILMTNDFFVKIVLQKYMLHLFLIHMSLILKPMVKLKTLYCITMLHIGKWFVALLRIDKCSKLSWRLTVLVRDLRLITIE